MSFPERRKRKENIKALLPAAKTSWTQMKSSSHPQDVFQRREEAVKRNKSSSVSPSHVSWSQHATAPSHGGDTRHAPTPNLAAETLEGRSDAGAPASALTGGLETTPASRDSEAKAFTLCEERTYGAKNSTTEHI